MTSYRPLANFNSNLVRLKELMLAEFEKPATNFNSNLVRLKV